jgi:hypothetical protein
VKKMNLVKIKQPTAAEICQVVSLEEKAKQLLTDNLTPTDFLQQLFAQGLYTDAVQFLANALPKREAVWWACLAARSTLNEQSPPTELKAIELAEAWVYRPTQESCQPTMQAAEAANFETPAAWAAVAAFWSGDNISPVANAAVSPPDELTAKAVAGAVMLAAVHGDAQKIDENYQRYLRQGIDVASGGDGRSVQ